MQKDTDNIKNTSSIQGDTLKEALENIQGGTGTSCYVMVFCCNAYTGTASTTFLFGGHAVLPPVTLFNQRASRQLIVPKSGTIKSAQVMTVVAGVFANSANSILKVYNITQATEGVITSTYTMTSSMSGQSKIDNYTGLNIPVTAGDKIQIQHVLPAYSSEPTQVYHIVNLYIE